MLGVGEAMKIVVSASTSLHLAALEISFCLGGRLAAGQKGVRPLLGGNRRPDSDHRRQPKSINKYKKARTGAGNIMHNGLVFSLIYKQEQTLP